MKQLKLFKIILLTIFVICALYLPLMYILNLENNVEVYSIYTLLIFILNIFYYFLSNYKKNKFINYSFYFSEFLFLLYLVLVFYLKEDFTKYKILTIPVSFFLIYQISKDNYQNYKSYKKAKSIK